MIYCLTIHRATFQYPEWRRKIRS